MVSADRTSSWPSEYYPPNCAVEHAGIGGCSNTVGTSFVIRWPMRSSLQLLCLGGRIALLLTYGDSPLADTTSADFHKKILHAVLVLGDCRLTGSDAPLDQYRRPQGFSVTLSIGDTHQRNASSIVSPNVVRWICPYGKLFGRIALAYSSINSVHLGR